MHRKRCENRYGEHIILNAAELFFKLFDSEYFYEKEEHSKKKNQ